MTVCERDKVYSCMIKKGVDMKGTGNKVCGMAKESKSGPTKISMMGNGKGTHTMERGL
jgi:hypothetical protein